MPPEPCLAGATGLGRRAPDSGRPNERMEDLMSRYLKVAVAVAAVLGLMALPGIAVADWNDGGVPITQDKTIKSTGVLQVSATMECPAEDFEVIQPGKKGFVEAIIVENKKGVTKNFEDCKPIGPWVSLGCTGVTAFETTGMPWTTHNTGSAVTVTGVNIDVVFSGGIFCPKNLGLQGEVTKTPDSSSTIHSYALSGTLKWSTGGEGETTVSGTMQVAGEDNGTFGL